jgi:hypothetical protein
VASFENPNPAPYAIEHFPTEKNGKTTLTLLSIARIVVEKINPKITVQTNTLWVR